MPGFCHDRGLFHGFDFSGISGKVVLGFPVSTIGRIFQYPKMSQSPFNYAMLRIIR